MFQVIDADLSNVNDVLSLQKSGQTFERESVLSKGTRVEVLLASCEVFLRALRNRRPGNGVGLDLHHERSAQRFRSLQVRELRALPRHDVSVGRATMNPDWALAFHPKPALLTRHAALMDGAILQGGACTKRGFLLPETPVECTSTRIQRQFGPAIR